MTDPPVRFKGLKEKWNSTSWDYCSNCLFQFQWLNIRKNILWIHAINLQSKRIPLHSNLQYLVNWGCPITCPSVISGSMEKGPYERLWIQNPAFHAWANLFVFRIISPKFSTNDMLQSPWLWWNSVHFRASKLHRTRWPVWPIGEEGWTLPALTSPTFPNPPPTTHPVSCSSSPHRPFHPSIEWSSQSVSRSGCPSVFQCLSATKSTTYWNSQRGNKHLK